MSIVFWKFVKRFMNEFQWFEWNWNLQSSWYRKCDWLSSSWSFFAFFNFLLFFVSRKRYFVSSMLFDEVCACLWIKIKFCEFLFVRRFDIYEWIDEISNWIFWDFSSYDRKSRVSIFRNTQFEFSLRIRHRIENVNVK